MIDFQPLCLEHKTRYDPYFLEASGHGCEYSFVNLYLWGRQKAAICEGHLVVFAQFHRKSVYLFPMGQGDKKPVLDAIIRDAADRGIPCRLTGLNQDDCGLLERLYPGQLHYHFDRDSFDYVYAIDDLADLAGRKYQKKRNHLNRFRQAHPDHRLEPITGENLPQVNALVASWYALRQAADPHADYRMEQAALQKALTHRDALGMEGLLLTVDGTPVAMSMGSFLREDTFDVHFEKALDRTDGAYAAINNGFAQHLRQKYPKLRYLNREDDLGLEGLRKAKLSYCPDHLVEKSWACLMEDGYDY